MPDEMNRLIKLMRAFNVMHRACVRGALEAEQLGELRNPHVLFMLQKASAKGADAMTQKEIADFFGIAPASAAVSLKRMEHAGLVNRVTDETDQRRNRITLTEKGKRQADACKRAIYDLHTLLVKGFDENEKQNLCVYYERMIDNMKTLEVRIPAMLDGNDEEGARA